MSYILDALKKAESERKLGSIPDMHAQPLATVPVTASPVWRRPYALGALAGALLIAGGVAWFAPWQVTQRSGTSPSQQASSGAGSIDTKRDAALVSPPVATQNTPPPIAQAPAEPPAQLPQEAVLPDAVKPKPAPAPVRKKKAEPAPSAATPRATEKKKESVEPALASTAEPRLPGFRDLPENIQREIPAMTVGGYIYSGIAAERSVLINNRLLREGSEISHGLVLEKMLPKEAVLNYKGYRYRIPY